MADLVQVPHWSGKNYRTVWMLGNNKVKIDVMSLDANAVGTKVADGIAGELRTRNQFIIDHYELKLVLQQQKLEAIRAVLLQQDTIDGHALPLGSAVGLVVTFNDGTKDVVSIQDVTLDDWSLSVAGRADRNKFTLPMRCNIFKIL